VRVGALSSGGALIDALNVWAKNPARAFYERLGGEVVDVQTRMVGGAELEEVTYRLLVQ
jgi:hypothetical protein